MRHILVRGRVSVLPLRRPFSFRLHRDPARPLCLRAKGGCRGGGEGRRHDLVFFANASPPPPPASTSLLTMPSVAEEAREGGGEKEGKRRRPLFHSKESEGGKAKRLQKWASAIQTEAARAVANGEKGRKCEMGRENTTAQELYHNQEPFLCVIGNMG